MSANFEELIAAVRIARYARDDDKSALDELQDEFNDRNAALIESARVNKERCTAAENLLREATLAAFALDPLNKKPANGVGIRMVTTYSYDRKVAFSWARERSVCLKLDEKAFEALAKASADNDMPVTMSQAPQATIATDL